MAIPHGRHLVYKAEQVPEELQRLQTRSRVFISTPKWKSATMFASSPFCSGSRSTIGEPRRYMTTDALDDLVVASACQDASHNFQRRKRDPQSYERVLS